MLNKLRINSGKVKKIITILYSKEKYVLHAAAWYETEKKIYMVSAYK